VFGTLPKPSRPTLFILVFGAFIALVGITATAQAVMVGEHFTSAAIFDVVSSDAATTRAFVNAYVRPSDLAPAATGTVPATTPSAPTKLETQLGTLIRPKEILRIELRRPDGTIVAANDPTIRGKVVPIGPDFALAVAGAPRAAILAAEAADAGPDPPGSETLLREYLPISVNGKVLGVVGIWRDAAPILERLAVVRRDVVLVTLSAAMIAAALLFLIFRAAQRRLTRQTAQLIESTRRDPLTGTLNHGAVIGRLAVETEAARAAGRPLTVALVDIDNFRLLNENHGHGAGDQALLAVAGLLRSGVMEPMILGRSGPDEFLIVAPPSVASELEPVVTSLQTSLVDLSLQFEATERLPITVSVGIATYPEHAASATSLLSTVTTVLEEAKASGGDTVRIASNAPDDELSTTSTFNVLEGLILAVDTKDRYTKRHSEDVARYAMFLAGRLGLDDDVLRTIQTAGLLHDIGKIGIPDHILRKPGKLTASEYDIVKQHVALGDMIVRDLPDLDQVRAGIRHHHERWDGDGYLDRLEGESIPLIARILGVADAFSAMTTTRPYRKALDVREALTRLEDAAGTQLEERLVVAFVAGMETASDAPLPGAEIPASALWTSGRRVA
jgi:diguanylate cyclase (GGDEF)-like protein/putative nucleotidyltransferase with HDIG domain